MGQRILGRPLCPPTRVCPRPQRANGWESASHIQVSRLLSTPRLALHPFCSHSYLLGGLGRWILRISDPAAPYLDGLAQEWSAPLGVGEVCRHGGWLCPSLRHPLAAGWKQGSRRVMQRAPGYTLPGRVEGWKGQGVTAVVGPFPGSQQLSSALILARSSSAGRKWTQWAGKPHPPSHGGSG